jgi:transcription initiation factor IIE alpha subunit
MSTNGTVERPVDQGALDKLSSVVQDALTPLVALYDQLDSEITEIENEMKIKLKSKREEAKMLRRVLKDAGLISRPTETRQTRAASSEVKPLGDSPRAQEARERIVKAIKSFEGEPFQISMVEDRADSTRNTVKRVIEALRNEEVVRFMGMRDQLNRRDDAPGGRKTATYQEIA